MDYLTGLTQKERDAEREVVDAYYKNKAPAQIVHYYFKQLEEQTSKVPWHIMCMRRMALLMVVSGCVWYFNVM
jgi:hypothetical protein